MRIGLRLCGIAEEPFCPAAERLEHLEHLASLQVPDLHGDALDRSGEQRERREERRVPIARHHLRRERLRAAVRAAADVAPRSRDVYARRCRRRRRACRTRSRRGRLRGGGVARDSSAHQWASFSPKRDRLGVDPVRAPDHRQALVAHGLRLHRPRASGRDRPARDRPLPSSAPRTPCPSRPRMSVRDAGNARGRRPFSASAVRNAMTSCCDVRSSSRTRATSDRAAALATWPIAVLSVPRPRSASASAASTSISSQRANFRSSDQIAAISGRE